MFSFEYTDLYAGEANYSWIKRFNVKANTQLGALRKVSKELGCSFKSDIKDFSWKSGNTILFVSNVPFDNAMSL